MATTETKGLMTYVDKNGNKFLIYPVTKAELVDGLDEAIQAFMAGLNYDDRYYTEAEIDQKLQGLPTAGHKHTKSDITDFPALGTAAAKNVGDFAAASHTHNYAGSSSAGGAANSANKLNTNAGSSTQGVYFKDGVPVVMTYTLGKSVPADAKFTDTDTWRGVQDNLTSTATDQSLSANQGKVLKGLLDGKAASSHTHDDRYYTESEMNTKLNGKANASHTHDDRYYTESEMNTKLNGKANSSHTHNYAGSSSAGGTANSVNGLTFAAQTTDPGAGSSIDHQQGAHRVRVKEAGYGKSSLCGRWQQSPQDEESLHRHRR